MVYPAGQGDLIWQGGVFGLSAPTSGGLTANVWRVQVTITHWVSSPASFTSVTAQIYDTNTTSVVFSQPFTLSSTAVTETITLTSGYTAADVPSLAARLVWHQTAVGFAAVQHSFADISYSYSDSIGMLSIAPAPATAMTAPAVSVAPLPRVALISAGTVVTSFNPAFGQPTNAGDLLIAWVFSNSSSSSFGTTCSDPSWTLAGSAGLAFGWESLWYKINCKAAETAPHFNDTAFSTPLSQLLEFTPVIAIDQVASGHGNQSVTYTAGGSDNASGDLIFGFSAWSGANATPMTIGLSATDSSGATLSLNTASNAASTGSQQQWITGWAQASAPVGPLTDVMNATISAFQSGGGLMASFKSSAPAAAGAAQPALRLTLVNRVVTVPIRIG